MLTGDKMVKLFELVKTNPFCNPFQTVSCDGGSNFVPLAPSGGARNELWKSSLVPTRNIAAASSCQSCDKHGGSSGGGGTILFHVSIF